MKENDWQILRYFLWSVLLFLNVFSFYGNSRILDKLFRNTCYNFLAIFSFALLQFHFASIFTFISDHSVKHFLLKCLLYIDMREFYVRIVIPKLHSLILSVTRRVVLLVHCIVRNLPISPQNHKVIWIFTLPSSVNFVIKSFQDLTLYDNIKKTNMAFLSRRMSIRTISSTILMLRILKKSCVLVKNSS